jgi:hypothetical protein
MRRRDYHALRTLSGVAPVTRRSGKTCVVVRRYARNKRLENALYHWARVATQHDPLSRGRYAALSRRGHSHSRALRTVADHLLSLAWTLLDHAMSVLTRLKVLVSCIKLAVRTRGTAHLPSCSAANSAYRKQSTTWSLTIPVACIKA